jgi:flagellar hook-associated protein 2
MAITSAGLGSGLDIEGIITKLMQVEAQPLTTLAKKEAAFQAKLTAVGIFQGAVSSFQSAASALNSTSTVNAVSASSSDTSAVSASGTSIASVGNYSIEVSQLAKAQQLVALGQASTSTSIGTGTITFDFGTISGGVFNPGTGQYTGSTFTSNGNGSQTVTIAAADDSLAGIRDAINAAGIGVTATIINDGSATPYRLALSSNSQGADNSIKITVSPALGGLDTFISNDPAGTQNLKETVTGQDALLSINGVSVTSNSNTVSSAISGVTLNLKKTNVGTPATVTVGRNSASFTALVDTFVDAYNDLNTTIKNLTKYDPETGAAGLLIGDSTVRAVHSQIRSSLFASVPGLTTGTYTNVTQVGLSLADEGVLTLDSSKFASALSTNADDVAALFASFGRPSDPLVNYISSTSTTTVSTRALNITTLATQGAVVGAAPVGLTTISLGINDSLSVAVDSAAATVTIAAGVYTQAQLNSAIQSAINGNSTISGAGISVAVTDTAGTLTITSNTYGSTSLVSIIGGNAATNLFGVASIAGTSGANVAGTIGGGIATGDGQYLTASDGLKLQILGGALGSRGSVEFTRGLGYLLDALTEGYLESDGVLESKADGINNSIDRITTQRETLNQRLAAIEKRYRAQFTALDTAISSLNNTSAFLTQQLAALTASTPKRG